VALNAMLIAAGSGAQAALLAPTEILARPALSTPSRAARRPAGQRRHPHRARQGPGARGDLDGLADGSIHILIGTHAIFQEAVSYAGSAWR
jgi:ATP-dependent DNA helicase RecG